jgi:hypothetical protein
MGIESPKEAEISCSEARFNPLRTRTVLPWKYFVKIGRECIKEIVKIELTCWFYCYNQYN